VKDQATLLGAARALRDAGENFELDMVGLDTMHGAIQRRPDAAAIAERTRWHGTLGRAALRELMEKADVLLVSSRHEAGPLVMLEAAVAGVPTVGTAVGHLEDWAPDAAIAVPVGSVHAMAGAVQSMLRRDDHRLAIAMEAQRRALAIDADMTASTFERVYHDMTVPGSR
jgi:glycosyltransferase involved in cell wall biosynthesis